MTSPARRRSGRGEYSRPSGRPLRGPRLPSSTHTDCSNPRIWFGNWDTLLASRPGRPAAAPRREDDGCASHSWILPTLLTHAGVDFFSSAERGQEFADVRRSLVGRASTGSPVDVLPQLGLWHEPGTAGGLALQDLGWHAFTPETNQGRPHPKT